MLLYLPDALLVVLSCWLGLSLLVRAPHDTATRAFAWFCLHLALYALSTLLPQLTASAEVAHVLNRLQLCTTVLAPTAFLHFIIVLTSPGYMTRTQYLLVGIFYTAGIAMSFYALFGPLAEPARPFPYWSRWGDPRFPDGPLVWAWFALRVLPMLAALGFMALAYRSKPHDARERLLRRIFAFTSLFGVVGGLAATVSRDLNFPPVLPRAMILAAMLALAYAVLVHRVLLPERVARRTFFYSLLSSLLVSAYVGLVLLLEWRVGDWLRLDVPLVSAFSLIILIATLDPLRDWFRQQLDQHFYRREFDYVRLVRSLGDELLEQGDLGEQVQSVLSVVCRALGVQRGLVVVASSHGLDLQGSYGESQPAPRLHEISVPDETQWLDGDWKPWPPARLLCPLRKGEDRLGLLILGEQHAPKPLSPSEHALLDYVNGYLTMAISYAHARDLQQDVIRELADQSRVLREQQEHLTQQAARAARQEPPPASNGGLHVYALGPLRVERHSEQITRWGGSKAGTYQAEALFAFLFDRRGKGVTKDEFAAVIWPDLDIDKSDSAFHRTLAALRRTLEPELRRGSESQAILYHHERYWLEPDTIAWCDTEAFLAAVEQGLNQLRLGNIEQALDDLAYASQLYRGDYMDDCPFFGDSVYVDEPRALLRQRAIEAQLALGSAYETQGWAGDAMSAYRRALALSPEDCPPAEQALERLQVVAYERDG
jgi:DNA-binding SARP family transcriptional activator